MNTPYFLIHEDLLSENIAAFRTALSDLWPGARVAYSVKTNSLPWVLDYVRQCGLMAEVVSDEEYDLALLCGFSDRDIVFNGPIKGEEHLLRALRGGAVVNLDAESDLACLSRLSGGVPADARIGLRVNVPPECFSPDDIGYTEDGFRFGFSDETGGFAAVLAAVRAARPGAPVGLHLHCNSRTRSVAVYRAIARYAAALIRRHRLTPAFLDMGGGYFGGVPGKPTAHDYIAAIREELSGIVDPAATPLFVEPGSAVIGSAVDLVTTVRDVKDTGRARIVTTDGSRVHIDPLWAKSRYLTELHTARENTHPRQIICGYTCMDHDRLTVFENEKELSVGDTVVYRRVGAYSMTFGGMFIRTYPAVYVEGPSGARTLVREAADMQTYYAIHSVRRNV